MFGYRQMFGYIGKMVSAVVTAIYDIVLHKGIVYGFAANVSSGIKLHKGVVYPSIRRM